MPEANLEHFALGDKTPAELEQRRRAIITSLTTTYKGYDDPNVPESILQELAVITGALRRKNAGPPKKAKEEPKTPKGKKTIDDVLGALDL